MSDRGDALSARGVLFFGAYDPRYPRNAILRKGLARAGIPVNECRVDERLKVHLRYPALLRRFAGGERRGAVVVVPEFRHKDVPLAWLLARATRRRLVFDPLVSRWETRVLDRGDAERGSAQERHNRNIDALSMRLPDLVLADTAAHGRFYAAEFGARPERVRVVPVGFDEDVFVPAPPRAAQPSAGHGTVTALFYGSFLPLHGVETIVAAARMLRGAPVRFVLVGAGQTRPAVERAASSLPPGLLALRDPVPESELPALIASADIALGIFGATPKARLVVPNKVYQSLACGRAVITAGTEAIAEFFEDGVHLLTVPPGDPGALARAIERLAGDRALRERVAVRGMELARSSFTSRRIGERLAGILREGRAA